MKIKYQDLVNRMALRLELGYILVRPNYQIDNAHATHAPNGQKLIEYNPRFMQKLENYSDWAALMVVAHEVAHHYNKDLFGRFRGGHNTSQRQELNADRFAGYMLRCFGARWDQATDVFEAIYFQGSNTHPDAVYRVEALRLGWNEAQCKNEPIQRIERTQYNSDTGKTIVGIAAGVGLIIGLTALFGGK